MTEESLQVDESFLAAHGMMGNCARNDAMLRCVQHDEGGVLRLLCRGGDQNAAQPLDQRHCCGGLFEVEIGPDLQHAPPES